MCCQGLVFTFVADVLFAMCWQGQVVQFDAVLPAEKQGLLTESFNAVLPADLRCLSVVPTHSGFVASQCLWKRYSYRIYGDAAAVHDFCIRIMGDETWNARCDSESEVGVAEIPGGGNGKGSRGGGGGENCTVSIGGGGDGNGEGSGGGGGGGNGKRGGGGGVRNDKGSRGEGGAADAVKVDDHPPLDHPPLDHPPLDHLPLGHPPLDHPPLDVEAMRRAGSLLVGMRDFASFQNKGGRSTTVRTVYRCDVHADGTGMLFTLEGDGFLYNMVTVLHHQSRPVRSDSIP